MNDENQILALLCQRCNFIQFVSIALLYILNKIVTMGSVLLTKNVSTHQEHKSSLLKVSH